MPLENGRDDQDETESTGGASRRNLMAAGAATWATATVAGCQDGATPTEEPTDEPTDSPTDTPEPQPANYVVTDEMATAGAFGVSFASACSPTRLFAPGMTAVWEVNVYDPETGDQLIDEDLDSVTVNVDGGGEVETQWAGDDEEHPAPYWNGSWDIPSDAETGEWTYTIEVATSDDANVRSVGEATGSFTVMEDEMPDFYLSTETYWNGHPAPEGTNGFVGTCAPEREFFPDMDPTFYVQLYETESGLLVGAPSEGTPTATPEGTPSASAQKISGTTVEGVSVSFPDAGWSDLELEWMSGVGDENTSPHWGATLTDPETLPTGSHAWEVNIEGVDETDAKIVGAAADVFNVIEKPQ